MRTLRSRQVATPQGLRPATVHLEQGRISTITEWVEGASTDEHVNVGELVVMPGIVDTHVHVNEPGRTDWEGFRSATRAAASGGVTTLVDMPLNSIPATVTAEALRVKKREAQGQCFIDVGFWGGVIPGNVDELEGLVREGARGFKCFMCHSGVDEFPGVTPAQMKPAMERLAQLQRPLLVHAEVEGPIDAAAPNLVGRDPRDYATYLASRPPEAEEQAIATTIELCRATGAHAHIVHHSAASALPLLRQAHREGLPVTAETCPHYLHFAAEDIGAGATTFKCAPPIRERFNRELLWKALGEGTLALVASDHSPCTPALKKQEAGDFMAAWGGISGLQLGVSVTWTEASARGYGLEHLQRWMCEAPARLAGLSGRKGSIAPGFDADFMVFDPEATLTVDAAKLEHKNKLTPYAGNTLRGVVHSTFVRGERVFHQGEHSAAPKGLFL